MIFKEINKKHDPKSNFHKWKGISRKPNKKQLLEGKYTLSNLRYYFGIALRNSDFPNNEKELIDLFPENYENMLNSIEKHFGKNAVNKNLINLL